MNKDEFYNVLDIENPSEFTYFENMAALFEHDDELDVELVYTLIKEVDISEFMELLENYFADSFENLNISELDFITLIEAIKCNLKNLCIAIKHNEQNSHIRLAEELIRFHTWYAIDKNCINVTNTQNEDISVLDALAYLRLEKLDTKLYDEPVYIDFSKALDYKLDEYVVSYEELTDSHYDSEI